MSEKKKFLEMGICVWGLFLLSCLPVNLHFTTRLFAFAFGCVGLGLILTATLMVYVAEERK